MSGEQTPCGRRAPGPERSGCVLPAGHRDVCCREASGFRWIDRNAALATALATALAWDLAAERVRHAFTEPPEGQT
ncbi:hypothetical protein QNO07_02675 [Streptomyces sp. 549]|uniref:hypothetical protein n=1 Tax=Streptomyces sp. 549 TaxID=3049076 RepID=UPI0024C27E1B|nr:hypothetical protein [Streptomyces sp. 549]MDK1472339.1 hypothetical protein [Streptomyces sp. 549]